MVILIAGGHVVARTTALAPRHRLEVLGGKRTFSAFVTYFCSILSLRHFFLAFLAFRHETLRIQTQRAPIRFLEVEC